MPQTGHDLNAKGSGGRGDSEPKRDEKRRAAGLSLLLEFLRIDWSTEAIAYFRGRTLELSDEVYLTTCKSLIDRLERHPANLVSTFLSESKKVERTLASREWSERWSRAYAQAEKELGSEPDHDHVLRLM